MVAYVFLILSFVLAGAAQTAWLRSGWSRRFARPLDGGVVWRGERLLGDNKTWNGFLVMVPGVSIAFVLFHWLFSFRSGWSDPLGEMRPGGYAALGAFAGLGYALGELPNSLIKRQCHIPPGEAPRAPAARIAAFLVDQTDSVLGALLAILLWIPLPWQTVLAILATGPGVHWLFNLALRILGVKSRAA